jgi:hypothetical protein
VFGLTLLATYFFCTNQVRRDRERGREGEGEGERERGKEWGRGIMSTVAWVRSTPGLKELTELFISRKELGEKE